MIRYEEGPPPITDKELFIEFMEATDRMRNRMFDDIDRETADKN